MIVTETALRSIFEQLPTVSDSNSKQFKPKFNWGSQDALNLFITTTKEKYPLIWLVESTETVNINSTERDIRLILAKNSNHQTNTNPIIWDSEFTTTLNPLLKNVITALERSGITTIVNNEYKVSRLANYSEETKKNKTVDVWNVIVFECKIRLNEKQCLKNIKF